MLLLTVNLFHPRAKSWIRSQAAASQPPSCPWVGDPGRAAQHRAEKDGVRSQPEGCPRGCVGRSACAGTDILGKSEQPLQKCSLWFFLLQNWKEEEWWGKGRERHTPAHKPKLISGVYSEITAKVWWVPLLPQAKDKWRYHLLSFSCTIFHREFIKNTDQIIQIPKPEYKGLFQKIFFKLMQLCFYMSLLSEDLCHHYIANETGF